MTSLIRLDKIYKKTKEKVMRITKTFIESEFNDIGKTAYSECYLKVYNTLISSYEKDLSPYYEYYDLFCDRISAIEANIEGVINTVNAHYDYYAKLTNEQFMFADKFSLQSEKYSFQLNALNYGYDIYCKYEFNGIGNIISDYLDYTKRVINDLDNYFYLMINKFDIPEQCANELCEYETGYNKEQWKTISKKTICVKLKYYYSVKIKEIIERYGGKINLCDNILIGLSKYKSVMAETTEEYKNGCEDLKNSISTEINSLVSEKHRKIKANIESVKFRKGLNLKKTFLSAIIFAFVVFIGVSHYIGNFIESKADSYYIATIVLSFVLVCIVVIVPGFILVNKSNQKIRNLENQTEQSYQQTIESVSNKFYSEGIFDLSEKIFNYLNENLQPLHEKYKTLFNEKGIVISQRYKQIGIKVADSTSFLPVNTINDTALLSIAYKQMQSGVANDYQTAIFQAQQIRKQEIADMEKKRREELKDKEEKQLRQELLESQQRAEEYAKEQAKQARKQASAAQEQAEYYRQMRDAQRENSKYAEQQAESAKKQADEAKKQRELQEEQKRMLEEEIRRNRGY